MIHPRDVWLLLFLGVAVYLLPRGARRTAVKKITRGPHDPITPNRDADE